MKTARLRFLLRLLLPTAYCLLPTADFIGLEPAAKAQVPGPELFAKDPRTPLELWEAVDYLVRTDQAKKAVPYLEAALQSSKDLLPAHASLGFALSQINKTAEAIPHLERALETDEDGSLHYQLARAYQTAGNAARAKELMTEYQGITSRSQSAKEQVAKEAEIVAPAQ